MLFDLIFFYSAGGKFGPLVTNRLRLVVAILLGMIHWIVYREPLPVKSRADRWFWLGISDIIGLAIEDLSLVQTYIPLGLRRCFLF